MAKVKKRPSKKQKEIQKILEQSKDLETSQAVINSNTNAGFKETVGGHEQGIAHKPRPNKKRG